MAPSDKPNRDRERRKSTMPISFIQVLEKAMDAVALHRLLSQRGGRLGPYQVAYLREKGAGSYFLEFSDFVKEPRGRGSYVYIACITVAPAFDAGPHSHLRQTIEKFGADTYHCR